MYMWADGAGSELNFPNMTQVNGSEANYYGPNGQLSIQATNGGAVNLSAVTSLVGGRTYVLSAGCQQPDRPVIGDHSYFGQRAIHDRGRIGGDDPGAEPDQSQ